MTAAGQDPIYELPHTLMQDMRKQYGHSAIKYAEEETIVLSPRQGDRPNMQPLASVTLLLPVPRLADSAVVLRGWGRVDLLRRLAPGVIRWCRGFAIASAKRAGGARLVCAVERDRVEGGRLELAVTASSSRAAVGSITLADLEHGNGMLR